MDPGDRLFRHVGRSGRRPGPHDGGAGCAEAVPLERGPRRRLERCGADPAVVDDAWRAWRAEVAFAEKFVANTADLGTPGAGQLPLRDVLVHKIEEYARHCGHADLLRERIDGRVGQ
jgi:Protein of unknown function (DUF664)